MRFHLHQDVLQNLFFLIAAQAGFISIIGIISTKNGSKTLCRVANHDSRVIAVSHDGVRRLQRMGVADHGEQTFVLALAIDDEVGIEDFVAAMLAIGLRKHHQLHIARVAPQAFESV